MDKFQMQIFLAEGSLDEVLRSVVRSLTEAGLARPMAGRASDGSCDYKSIRSSGMPSGLAVNSAWGGRLVSLTWQDDEAGPGYSGNNLPTTRVDIGLGNAAWSASRAYEVIAASVAGKAARVSGLLEPEKELVPTGLVSGTSGHASGY